MERKTQSTTAEVSVVLTRERERYIDIVTSEFLPQLFSSLYHDTLIKIVYILVQHDISRINTHTIIIVHVHKQILFSGLSLKLGSLVWVSDYLVIPVQPLRNDVQPVSSEKHIYESLELDKSLKKSEQLVLKTEHSSDQIPVRK